MQEATTSSLEALKAYSQGDELLVSEREKLAITRAYYWMVTGETDKEIETEEMWRQAYPRDTAPLNDLAVNHAIFLGQFEKGMEEANEAIRISPHELAVFDVVAVAYLAQNRPDEARAILTMGLGSNPDNPNIHFDLHAVAAALR